MRNGVNNYLDINSPLHRWETRLKIITLAVLILCISILNSITLLSLLFLLSIILYKVSKLPVKMLLKRIIIPGIFVLVSCIFILLASNGDIVFKLWIFSITMNGIIEFFRIMLRFISIFTLITVLFETSKIMDLIKAMNTLGLSGILTDIMLFTFRYIFQLADNLYAMQTAMKLRGFKFNSVKDIKNIACLIGTLFVRSYEQSRRVYDAMILRGYRVQDNKNYKELRKIQKYDIYMTCAVSLAVLIVVGCEIIY